MAESTASLRAEIKALSGVDIMLNENTFKSTYQIMEELSQKWEDLSDIAQATIIELVAGKHQGNVFSSLMANFDIAKDALNTSLESSGSAMAEHAKWSESLEARLNKLKATWQSFAQTFMDSKTLKVGIDLLAGLVGTLDKLVDNFGLLGTIGLGVLGKNIFSYFNGVKEAKKTITDVANGIEHLTEVIEHSTNATNAATDANMENAASEAIEAEANTASVTSETVEAEANLASASSEASEAAANATSATSEFAETEANAASAASELAEAEANVVSYTSELAEVEANTASAASELAEAEANATSYTSELGEAMANTANVATETAEAVGNVTSAVADAGASAVKSAGGFAKFFGTFGGKVAIIAAVVAAIGLLYNQYKKAKEAAAEARQEAIRASDEFLDAASSFEQAYIKYSGRTDLTAQEESELEMAINGTVDALGDKSSALKDVVNSSNDYVTSLEAIKNAELEAAKKAAEDKKRDAELELEEAAMGWERWDGSEVNFEIDPNGKAYDIAKGLNSKYLNIGKRKVNDLGSTAEFAKFELSKDATTKDIIGYYNTLVDYRDRLKEKLSEEELMDSGEYEEVNAAIEKMTESINTYIEGVYEAAKANYQLANGIPETTEEYIKMREAILSNTDLDGASVETLKSIANDLDANYGQVFDLSSIGFQARKLVGILDEYGDSEIGQMETFLNMRTAVNNNECTVGEYMSQFDEIDKMTEGWSDEAKKELNTSFGLDTDYVKQQYEDMEKYLLRQAKKSSDEVIKMSRQEARAYYNELGNVEEEINEFLDSLTADELSAFISIKTEIDWQNTSKEEILKQIQEEAEFLEAMNYTIAIDVETESIEALNTAMAESVSGAGLSSEAIAALKGRYAELESEGYNLSAMFEETANGIHLNRKAVSELEQKLASDKLAETDKQLGVLKNRYDELTTEIDKCRDAGDRAALYTEQQSIVDKINDLATLAAQYEGLTSAYNAWQSAESAGSERDMYEGIISGFETVEDEIKRGWFDDGSIEFLELLTGKTDLAGKSGKQLKEIYDSLDDTIKNTTYSVRDFFTVDEDGNSTNTGVYNFLDAVHQLEKTDKFKNIEGIEYLSEKDENGNIIGFNFELVAEKDEHGNVIKNGDQVIAEALGISEELVQIMIRASDDAGFVVNLEGAYTQLADLKTEAEAARDTLISLKNKGLKELKGVDVNFDFNAEGNDLVKEQANAIKLLDKFKKNGKIDLKMEGAQQALDIAEYLTIKLDDLTEPKFMKIDASEVEEGLQDPIEKIQEIGRLCREKHLVSLTGDTKELEEVQDEIDKVAEELEDLEPEVKAKIGIDKKWDADTIANKIEKGEIEIPAELKLDVQMSDDLKDMRLMMMNQLGLVDDNEVKLKVGFDIDDSIVDSLDDKQKEIAVKYIVKNKKEFEKYTEEEKETVVKLVADGVNLDKYKPEEKEAIVNYIANGEEADGWTPEAKDAFVKYLVDGGEPDKFDPKDKESWVVYKKDSTVPDTYDPEDPEATVTYDKDSSVPDAYDPDKNGVVTFKKDSSAIDKWKPVVTGIAKFTLSMIIPAGVRAALRAVGISIADGTANVNGSAFSDGTATKLKLTGKALKQGDWGVKKTENALVGELGQELVVYKNRYWTVGDSGAEFSTIPKGAIVFNHRQTEELFANGKVTSGGGRGKALASGTAFSGGSGGLGGVGKAKKSTTTTTKETTKKTTKTTTTTSTGGSSGSGGGVKTSSSTSSKVSDSAKETKDEFEETFDWIETAINRVERSIDQLDTKASSVYRSWSERNSNLANEIEKVKEEINLQNAAYEKYIAAANEVGLSSSWINKIKNGSISIDTITDEDLSKKVSQYKEYYEKAIDCKDAILELKEKESELYQQRFDNIATQYEGMLSIIEHEKNMLDEYIAQSEAQAHLISENYYKALISNEKDMISKLQAEKSALLSELATQERGTEQWYANVQAIDEVTLSIAQCETAILEWQQSIEQLKFEQFDLLQEKISAITQEADFLVELLSNDKLFDDNGKTTDEGMATIGLHGVNYNTYMHQADLAREEAERIKKELAKDPYDTDLEARYREMIALQQEHILAAEGEKEAIRDLVEEGIDKQLDSLQELIDKKDELLESERDLYEYQKKVKEQTSEIANLEKQLSAYEDDNSEEAKAKVQQIKVDLESARQELQETETDRLIESTASMLDSLYLEYEEVLNMRLDNVDALIADVITQINADASSINATLTQAATDVGYSLSTDMSTIWDTNSTKINTVITTYGDRFSSAQTTTNTVLGNIKTDLATMISQLNSIANTKAKTAANSSVANYKKQNVAVNVTKGEAEKKPEVPKSENKQIKVGGKINAAGAPIYDYAGDTSGERQLYRNDPIYTVLSEKNGYILTRHHKLSSGYTGWFKKSDVKAYATGAKKIDVDDLAWTQEGNKQEFIVRPSDGAILTPVAKGDSVLNAQASRNIWNMANSPAEFIKGNLSLDSGNVPNISASQNTISQNFENITFALPNVRNYNELLSDLQHDPKFEKLILAMTLDQVVGKSKLAKGKVIR